MNLSRYSPPDLSSCRNFCMGAAIIWVMLYHFKIPSPAKFFAIGFCGVDLFLFLSAFGCCFSYHKDQDFPAFMKRRVIRILPTYFVYVLLHWALTEMLGGQMTLQQLMANITCTGIYFGTVNRTNWYLQAIWLFYLLFPLFFAAIWRAKKPLRTTLSLILISLVFVIPNLDGSFVRMLFLTRYPIFILGTYAGIRYLRKQPFSWQLELLAYCILAAGMPLYLYACGHYYHQMTSSGLLWLLFFPLVPGMLYLLCRIAQLLSVIPVFTCLHGFISYLGQISMELLLIHVMIAEMIVPAMTDAGMNVTIPQRLLMIAACILLAAILHHIMNAAVKKAQSFFQTSAASNPPAVNQ